MKAISTMGSEEPIYGHNTSAGSLSMSPEPSSNPLVVKLINPVVSTTQMLDISAAPSNVPTNVVIAEKGPTGMTKKAGIMQPNSHSKTAR